MLQSEFHTSQEKGLLRTSRMLDVASSRVLPLLRCSVIAARPHWPEAGREKYCGRDAKARRKHPVEAEFKEAITGLGVEKY